MRLVEYLAEVGETADQFAARAGITSGTIHRVVKGGSNPRADIADRIIRASQEKPASDGRCVTLPDLVVEREESAA